MNARASMKLVNPCLDVSRLSSPLARVEPASFSIRAPFGVGRQPHRWRIWGSALAAMLHARFPF
ncbi:MAG: hypothetical protein DMG03_02100 [Acidobacteria bacterium]|nr:MAG: hypothetical protein DMG03_02100 [Acidobacteriota bacterium]